MFVRIAVENKQSQTMRTFHDFGPSLYVADGPNHRRQRLTRSGSLSIGTVKMIRVFVPFCILVVCSCGAVPSSNAGPEPCTEQWFQYVDDRVPTGDAEGHGPDLGSSEWRSVVEFKLGIRGDSQVPQRDTVQWCTYIDKEVRRDADTIKHHDRLSN